MDTPYSHYKPHKELDRNMVNLTKSTVSLYRLLIHLQYLLISKHGAYLSWWLYIHISPLKCRQDHVPAMFYINHKKYSTLGHDRQKQKWIFPFKHSLKWDSHMHFNDTVQYTKICARISHLTLSLFFWCSIMKA